MAAGPRPTPVEVFRQFAWNLAGSLARPKSGAGRPADSRRAKR